MQLESMYQEIILDHYRNPQHKGLRDPFQAEVHHVNPTCGDEITLRVQVDGDQVADVSYEGQGCSISQASASVMADLVIGGTVADGLAKHAAFLELMQSKGEGEPDEEVLEDGVAFAGVSRYPARVKCALLGWMAWKDATAQAAPDPVARALDSTGNGSTGTSSAGTNGTGAQPTASSTISGADHNPNEESTA